MLDISVVSVPLFFPLSAVLTVAVRSQTSGEAGHLSSPVKHGRRDHSAALVARFVVSSLLQKEEATLLAPLLLVSRVLSLLMVVTEKV